MRLTALLLGLLAGLATLPAWAAPAAGRIDLVDGDVRIVDRQDRPRPSAVGEPVQQGDTVTTGRDGEIHLKMSDGGVLALRPDASLTIVRHQDEGKASDSSLLRLVRGALRTITGWIGRRSPENVRVQTPTATIGIRGTDHEVVVIPKGSDLGTPGTYDKVNAGGTRLTSQGKSVDLVPGQAGHAPLNQPPEVLPSVPAFFSPARHDSRLEGLNDAFIRNQESRSGNAATAGATTAGTAAKGSNVSIQGNTSVNAVSKDASAIAVGQGNEASNQIGTIGGK